MASSSDRTAVPEPCSNFWMLASHQPELAKLGARAESYFSEDPNTCLLKLRQFAELLAQTVAAQVGEYTSASEEQVKLLRRLESAGHLTREVAQVFHEVRRLGNSANHKLAGTHSDALSGLKLARQLAVWYHRCTVDRDFKPGAFIPPLPPRESTDSLKAELARLQQVLEETARQAAEHKESLAEVRQRLEQSLADQESWRRLAEESEQSKAELAASLQELQTESLADTRRMSEAARAFSRATEVIDIDEATTRSLIDQQLRDAGWEADSVSLRHSLGCRPQKGRNMAIAEWPTSEGRADYVLFCGLMPVATVEAKKKNKDVSAALKQAKRYSRDFVLTDDMTAPPGQPWGRDGEYKIPFGFSTNGRPYLKQIEHKSGIWFIDMRRPTNHGRALVAWYTPEGLSELLKLNEAAAEEKLTQEPFTYDLKLRDYQIRAIKDIEAAIASGRREMLVAMATGTGKTKTAIALIYRLLKTRRFRRVLFVVDRFALGDQAGRDFKSTRMEDLRTFADTFGLKELGDIVPDKDTCVHIATIQGLIKRTLYSDEPPPVDQYDCIIVDECHRGYLLDRDLSDTELEFRDQQDYISKYRRVLEYFDAVKIGLTATPALHTTQIFGQPVTRYTYREAVIDEVLIDHEPPINILTRLARDGIVWAAGAAVGVYNPVASRVDYFNTPDEIKLEVDEFNKKVITENFNRAVCKELAKELDPSLPGKTLIFCATDSHADLVVTILKEELAARYCEIDDDAVEKITAAADKPLELILKYKNEQLPKIAVTVDLLTTGIDVPEIVNLVFIRRVNSRILYEQMLGRATRRCDHIGKEVFRIYDAVGIYDALQEVTDMHPVVVNPKITFGQLLNEIKSANNPDLVALARDQFIAKLQRKKRHLTEQQAATFEEIVGQTPEEFIRELRR
ncbi:MAG TPA: type I restriction-modification system endonuclease, partial [Candidatus Obscuribacterales bacterium]